MSETQKRVLNRLTGVIPLIVGAVIYIGALVKPQFGINLTSPTLSTFNLVAGVLIACVVCYSMAASSFFFVSTADTTFQAEVTRRLIMVASPVVSGFLLGSIDSSVPSPLDAMPVSLIVVTFLVFIFFGSIALLFVVDSLRFLLTTPMYWLMGSPPYIDAPTSNQIPIGKEITPVKANDTPGAGSQQKENQHEFDWKQPRLNFKDLVGVDGFKVELAEAIDGFRAYSSNAGLISDRNGILLSGPPGNGKTTVAEAIAGELGLPFVKIGGQDITSKWVNESPAVVKELFRQASLQPCVVFFDEFESVAMDRSGNNINSEDKKVVNTLLSEIDSARRKRIVLIAATNYVEQVDSAIARDGRFDWRMSIPYPDETGRAEILTGMLAKFDVKADASVIADVAMLWHMRPVSFIESTVKRLRDRKGGTKGGKVTLEDLKQASRDASRNASAIPASGAKLSDLILPGPLKKATSSLVGRLRNWEAAGKSGGEAPSGIVFYGPPGTGKTNLVRAIARELGNWHVFEVSAPEVLASPKEFRRTLDLASKHRPAIVFIDEADDLLKVRMHSHTAAATNEILKCMDGMMGKIPEVVFMAATNSVELLDGAALRGGRFSEQIEVDKLSGENLVALLSKEFSKRSMVRFSDDVTPELLAERLGECAAADAIGVLQKAINQTFDQPGGRAVMMEDIEDAMRLMRLA